jgi:hypothetical protein
MMNLEKRSDKYNGQAVGRAIFNSTTADTAIQKAKTIRVKNQTDVRQASSSTTIRVKRHAIAGLGFLESAMSLLQAAEAKMRLGRHGTENSPTQQMFRLIRPTECDQRVGAAEKRPRMSRIERRSAPVSGFGGIDPSALA